MNLLLSEDEFKYIDGYQCLYFYIDKMPFHKKMVSMINSLYNKYNFIQFIFVNVNIIEKSFLKRFNINEVPVLLLFNNDNKILEIKGIALTSAVNSSFYKVLYNK